jgi:hypothetical protein
VSGRRDRSRRAALQDLLGELGTVLPYTQANGRAPATGWYIQLTTPPEVELEGMWVARNGTLYAGIDVPHAAVTIERLHVILERA